MTPPVAGFPDYARLQVQSSQILATLQAAIGGSPSTPVIDCAGFGYINISVNALGTNAHFWVNVKWYIDAAGTNQIATAGFNPPPQSQNGYQFPVMARYLIVTNGYLSGTTTDTPATLIVGSNARLDDTGISQVNAPYLLFNGSIAASSTQTLIGTTLSTKRSSICMEQETNNKWRLDGFYHDRSTDTFVEFCRFDGANLGQSWQANLGIPPSYIQWIIANTDTSARTCHFSHTCF